MNYILYSLAAGYVACWWFVSRYGGSMPPPGSFDDFLSDMWGWLFVIFSSPFILTIATNYYMSQRKRSGEG
jgi:uncharacterized protein YqgC (DUF456 family)